MFGSSGDCEAKSGRRVSVSMDKISRPPIAFRHHGLEKFRFSLKYVFLLICIHRLLNFVAKRAKFNDMDVQEVIKFYGLLSFCQQVMLRKVSSHVLDSIKVHESEPEPKKAKAQTKAK